MSFDGDERNGPQVATFAPIVFIAIIFSIFYFSYKEVHSQQETKNALFLAFRDNCHAKGGVVVKVDISQHERANKCVKEIK